MHHRMAYYVLNFPFFNGNGNANVQAQLIAMIGSMLMIKYLMVGSSEASVGAVDPTHTGGPTYWSVLSKSVFWKFLIAELAVGRHRPGLCLGSLKTYLKIPGLWNNKSEPPHQLFRLPKIELSWGKERLRP